MVEPLPASSGAGPAGEAVSKSVLLPPKPCSITIVGNGPLPLSGRVTSTSSGTPSKEGTREAESTVGQKRTPFSAVQGWPNGAVEDAAAGAANASAAANAVSTASREIRELLTWAEHTPLPVCWEGHGRTR